MCADFCVIVLVQGCSESDARELIDLCNETAQLVENVINLVFTLSEDPSAFPQLATARKLLFNAVQSVSSVAAQGADDDLARLLALPPPSSPTPFARSKPLPARPDAAPHTRPGEVDGMTFRL